MHSECIVYECIVCECIVCECIVYAVCCIEYRRGACTSSMVTTPRAAAEIGESCLWLRALRFS
jgi:hypothetical protein